MTLEVIHNPEVEAEDQGSEHELGGEEEEQLCDEDATEALLRGAGCSLPGAPPEAGESRTERHTESHTERHTERRNESHTERLTKTLTKIRTERRLKLLTRGLVSTLSTESRTEGGEGGEGSSLEEEWDRLVSTS